MYEGGDYKKEQKVFRPTPIISPIYGILDKNYKKEEIVQKKEVRLSQASSKKVDVDTVREKAYGDLVSDITASMMSDDEADNNESNKENVFNSDYFDEAFRKIDADRISTQIEFDKIDEEIEAEESAKQLGDENKKRVLIEDKMKQIQNTTNNDDVVNVSEKKEQTKISFFDKLLKFLW